MLIRKFVVAGTVAALATAGTLLAGSPAMAASRSEKCVSYACGSGTFSFTGKKTVRDISLSIKDPDCNQHLAYIRFRVHYAHVDGKPDSATGQKRFANSSCGAGYKTYSGLKWDDDRNIVKASIVIGDDASGHPLVEGNLVNNNS
jgi:hypothetical protein